MRTLYFCRHAKSSWADPGQDDFDRPLNERGLRDAPNMARLFKERGDPVDLIVSSPANRALNTARAFGRELRVDDAHFIQEPLLYHATVPIITSIVTRLPNEARRVILFGHNPGFSEVVEHYSTDGVGDMPTCGIARIDFVAEAWNELARDLGTLVWFDYPKRHQ